MKPSDNHPRINELSALPPASAPPQLWAAIRNELDTEAHSKTRTRLAWIGSGLAAALALVIGMTLFQPANQPASDSVAMPETARESSLADEMVQMRRLSAALEASLRDKQQGAVSTLALEELVLMENELGWLDMRLASQPGNLDLWQRRVEILGDMNRLYSRNHWQNQIRLTSL